MNLMWTGNHVDFTSWTGNYKIPPVMYLDFPRTPVNPKTERAAYKALVS